MVKSFCKDCPSRHTICHDTCPQYQKYNSAGKLKNNVSSWLQRG